MRLTYRHIQDDLLRAMKLAGRARRLSGPSLGEG